MSEKLSNRREAASAEYEQTERYRATQYLVRIGILKKVNQLNLFHGREGDGSTGWRVDPSFNNADNNTGHYNINKRPALNTSDFGTAHEFSIARSGNAPSRAEIYHIVSEDPDATIVDSDAISMLNHDQRINANRATSSTLIGVTDGAPLDFENRHALDRYSKKDFQNEYGLMFDEEIGQFSRRLDINDDAFVRRIGSAINTHELLRNGYLRDLCDAFMDNNPTITISTSERGLHSVPINHEYLANWFRKNHIVGYKKKVRSATLHGQIVDNYMLFDLEKVNTESEIEKQQREREQQYGEIDSAIRKHSGENSNYLLGYLSKNLYISPRDIVKLAKLNPVFKEVLESDAGNWEGFKLEEHTETVLRVFDDNFADYLPSSVIPLMRLALLVHDLGKPEATRHHDKANQKQYNLHYADAFLKANKVDKQTTRLIETMVGDGMKWTERWMIKRDKSSGTQFYDFCARTMKDYLGKNRVSSKTVFAFRCMLEVLQTCDSAAYTTMAVTRAKNGVVYKNYGAFNDAFDSNHGLTGHRARIK